jgi:hypothetical protein
LIEIREKLDHLIQSLTIEKKGGEEPKEEQGKKIHRLTPAELGKKNTHLGIHMAKRVLTH